MLVYNLEWYFPLELDYAKDACCLSNVKFNFPGGHVEALAAVHLQPPGLTLFPPPQVARPPPRVGRTRSLPASGPSSQSPVGLSASSGLTHLPFRLPLGWRPTVRNANTNPANLCNPSNLRACPACRAWSMGCPLPHPPLPVHPRVTASLHTNRPGCTPTGPRKGGWAWGAGPHEKARPLRLIHQPQPPHVAVPRKSLKTA